MRLLLEAKASADATFDQTDLKGCTPLWIACNNGHPKCARLLLEAKAAVDRYWTANRAGSSARPGTCARGVRANRYLQAKANVELGRNELTAIYAACAKGQVECARLLLEANASLHSTTPDKTRG